MFLDRQCEDTPTHAHILIWSLRAVVQHIIKVVYRAIQGKIKEIDCTLRILPPEKGSFLFVRLRSMRSIKAEPPDLEQEQTKTVWVQVVEGKGIQVVDQGTTQSNPGFIWERLQTKLLEASLLPRVSVPENLGTKSVLPAARGRPSLKYLCCL
ncbi:hypothetical protein FA15DRAFT_656694 [Coprinopsis marcescibilis]|uniref:Uncharacterized protein n=1 Tax=Coprinopsis marcescibilis TaxID=230819 RepID=A0A5C3KUC6_COPMA|nr:hypothetical protein FA15DRAFT_656694 [Coprinopsis marcescibilis]